MQRSQQGTSCFSFYPLTGDGKDSNHENGAGLARQYREDGMLAETPRANLPLQTMEIFGPEAAWRNKLIWGDNLLVMGSLLENSKQRST